jgi:hypothetical protein
MIKIIKNNIYLIAYINIFFISFLFRFIDLGNRAVHHDESLHGYFSYITSNGDYYSHNPLTHGMFLFNTLSGIFWLLGSNEFLLRLPFAFVGLCVVFTPILIRKEIGDKSTIFISLLIGISPSLAYFSRFARNDIFMTAILIVLIISIYKYVITKKNFWLFLSVGTTALGFTVKESMYLNLFGILIFLFLYSLKDLMNVVLSKTNIKEINHITKLFLILFFLSLPLAAPLLSIFQSSLGIILATPDSYPGVPPGLPLGNGIIFSIIITIVLLLISSIFGLMIDKKLWITSFSIFFLIYTAIFTSFFINPSGIITGHWQSLGYWLSQHDVARGSQPFYYYFIILLTNEFLLFLFGLPLSIYYLLKGNFFEKLLSFTAFYSLIAFSIAGEKMPWLIVNLIIPYLFLVPLFIVKSANRLNKPKEILLLFFVSSSVMIFFFLKLLFTNYSIENNNLYYDLIFLIISTLIIGISFTSKKIFFPKEFFISLMLVFFIFMTLLTIKTTNKIIFDLSDEPMDMLIYTQTSNSLHSLNNEINASRLKKENLIIGIDTLDGFAWPWMWYLRDVNNVIWVDKMQVNNHAYDYLLINDKNFEKLSSEFLLDYNVKRTISHRKWFPESIYRDKSFNDFLMLIIENKNRTSIADYYMNRNFQTKLGSSNFVLLKSKKFESIE